MGTFIRPRRRSSVDRSCVEHWSSRHINVGHTAFSTPTASIFFFFCLFFFSFPQAVRCRRPWHWENPGDALRGVYAAAAGVMITCPLGQLVSSYRERLPASDNIVVETCHSA